MNWLGTDDQARDVTARLIYGFRMSVLFGLTLTIISSALIGIAAGAVQGYFGGWTDLLFQRFIEIWTSMPLALSALIIAAVLRAGLLDAARSSCCLFSWVAFVGLVRAEFLRGAQPSNMCARRGRWASAMRIMFRTCCPTRWWRR
jgi:microcin C transport system permease protein